MTVAAVILSALLALEFFFAPVNLWTGRTMDNYRRFTGLPESFATRVLAPVKLATAVALVAGIWVPAVSVVGAAVALLISVFYLVRLAAPGRRDPAGIAGFLVFGALAAALLVVRLAG